MHWSSDLVGLPYLDRGRDRSGVDCWGLVRLAFAEVRGIILPSCTELYASAEERAEIAAALSAARVAGPWRRVDRPAEWDVVAFARSWGLDHVGLIIAPGLMLHACDDGQPSRVERYAAPKWARRLEGFYRAS